MHDLTPQIRTRLRRVEWLVLAFLVGSGLLFLLALGWWLKTTGDARGWFVTEVPYYTYLDNAGAIREGTPVKMMGFTIGKVDSVTTAEDTPYNRSMKFNVYVHFLVREPYYGYIHSDSICRLGGTGVDLLGGSWLELTRAEGQGVPTVVTSNAIPQVLNDQFAYKSPSLERTNKYLVYHPFKSRDSGYFMATIHSVSLMDNAEDTVAMVHEALPGLTNAIAGILGDLQRITSDLRPALARPGGLGELVIPTNLMRGLETTLNDLHRTQDNLQPVITNAGVTLAVATETAQELKPLFLQVQGAVSNVQALVVSLESQVASTNLVGNFSRLADKAALLADTTDTLMRRHWLFRSAFKTNEPNSSNPTRQQNTELMDRRRF